MFKRNKTGPGGRCRMVKRSKIELSRCSAIPHPVRGDGRTFSVVSSAAQVWIQPDWIPQPPTSQPSSPQFAVQHRKLAGPVWVICSIPFCRLSCCAHPLRWWWPCRRPPRRPLLWLRGWNRYLKIKARVRKYCHSLFTVFISFAKELNDLFWNSSS